MSKNTNQKSKPKEVTLPLAAIKQLGTMPTGELAEKFNVPIEVVRREMQQRGVVRYSVRLEWNRQQVKLLGTAADEEIARQLGVTKTSVTQRRQRLGIAAFGESRAEKSHRWTKQQLSWLGKLPDSVIAERLGVTPPTVAWKRRLLGIGVVNKMGRPRREWTQSELALLGTMPDTEVAKRLKIHRHQVGLQRASLGIPRFNAQDASTGRSPKRPSRKRPSENKKTPRRGKTNQSKKATLKPNPKPKK